MLCSLASAQTPIDAAVRVTAQATTSPLAITFTWPLDPTATAYSVARRLPGTTAWGGFTAIPGGGAATSWVDTNALLGGRYEYFFQKSGNPVGKGFLTAGIEGSAIHDRGKLILLVDATKALVLQPRLDRLVQDLTGDGWFVIRHDVLPTQSVPSVKALITAAFNADPLNVKAVFLLGRVPVPYSGSINPDGHPDHQGAWPADVFYGELNGTWTDATVNITSATRPENRNVPGDGKYDQSTLPSDVDLIVGRVDLSNMPAFGSSEDVLLQNYLDKDHDYRHKVFTVAQQAVIDDNFGWFGGEAFAATGWRNFSVLCGSANVIAADYFTTLSTTSGPGYVWSYGCGGGSYLGAGGVGATSSFTTSTNRNVFTILFGSYFGDWDVQDNFLRAPLCSGWTLVDFWAGRPHWSFHQMGMGDTIGTGARHSQNDTYAGGFATRFVHVALMGDPTLRQHVIAPASGLAASPAWPQVLLSWSASPDPVAGYHVYRAASPAGPFTRLTTAPVAGTTFAHAAPPLGSSTYMVRALRLETTPSGSYWNLSQGVFATVVLQGPAAHTEYGSGCYTISDSFYQYFATPAAASAALNGSSITLTPAGSGYAVTHGGGAYLAPSPAATMLALGDDAQTAFTPSAPVPYPGGSATTLSVHSNGIIAVGPLAMPASPNSHTPNAADFLGEAATAWYCWHDYNPTEPGSGNIVWEEVGGVLHVTWQGVESHPVAAANPSTLQFQFDLATGVVKYVWSAIASVGTGTQTGTSEQHLIGWSPGGASVDAGSIDLATVLPLTVTSSNMRAISLSASPPPVSTGAAGTLVTYAIDDIPPAAPASNSYLGLTILSLTPDPVGTQLAFLGMPGCSLYVGSIDLALAFAGSTPQLTTQFQIPAGVAYGTQIFATAVALFVPNSLPNGQNAFGAVTSNGVASFISSF
ncbi:MAG TPA: hypothetical protein VFT55_08750 [Planctomycetota bacterium]|nr:hypothetical protein [Planctomycetota bacterium]